ncbi:MAG TPA: diguanylate cyclase response regulator [Nitrospiraceae bacterium]|nr:diguanylate cyclase response regulator [Nitrospiraceae bacterium]
MAKARILLVEDSKPQADVTKEFLERNGYEVQWAQDGASAIKLAKTTQPDVMLLDLVLPDISGNEVCRWLKLNNETKPIPIIMLTIKSSLEDKVSAIEAGADDHLPKPYNESELNAKIYAALRTKALQDELRERNKQMEELLVKFELLAITDPLTNLFNRRRFETILEKELKKSKRYMRPLTCLMIDIDHFKRVNDLYSHEAGDSVLKEVGQLIHQALREADTIARWGGEEFVALLPETDKNQALQPASRILTSVSSKRFEQIPDECVTVSVGIACADSDSDTPAKLVNAADLALYEAKRKGRNRIEFVPKQNTIRTEVDP